MIKRYICLAFIFFDIVYVVHAQISKEYKYNDSLIQENLHNRPEVSLKLIKKQEELLKNKPKEELYYDLMFAKAECLNSLGIFDESLKIFYSILSDLEKKPDAEKSIKAHYYLGLQYFQMEDHKKAMEMYQRAKKIAINNKRFDDTIKINLEIGLEYAGLDQAEKGIPILKKNIENAKLIKDETSYVVGCDNLSNLYNEIGDYENALKYQLLLFKSPEAHISTYSKTAVFQHLAEINISLKRYKEAQFYLDSAFYYGKILNSNDWLFDCHKNQFQIDEALGKSTSALYHHKQYLALKDSVYKENYDSKMSAMASFYELENKENKITNLKLDQQLSSTRIQRLYLILASLTLLTLSSILYLLYKKNKKEKDLQKMYSIKLLESQEQERQRIARELHDSVGQNILFIKNQIKKIFNESEPRLSSSIDNVLEDVRNISKDLYPNELEKFGLESAIEELAKQITLDYNIFVSSDMQDIDQIESKSIKINVYRIIQEFINNSIKHAEAKAIRITSKAEDGLLKLLLQDNGKGFDLSSNQNKGFASFGLINVEERVKLMNGRINMESIQGQGTTFEVFIPI